MAIEVRLPQYGMAMQEGTIVQWFKHEGDRVEAGELLAEIEAEKATEELAAPESGVLEQILVPREQPFRCASCWPCSIPATAAPAEAAVGPARDVTGPRSARPPSPAPHRRRPDDRTR